MSNHHVCEAPVVIQCPELFRLRASHWINKDNIGDTEILTIPPSGVRLRWNCPFQVSDPSTEKGLPKRYSIWRSEPLEENMFVDYHPKAGHIPRNQTLSRLWKSLRRVNDKVFMVDGLSDCESVDAVYFELPIGDGEVTVSLTGVDGRTKVSGKLKGGDRFYFELAGINRVVFSSDPRIQTIKGLTLPTVNSLDGIEFKEIASIDAEFWKNAELGDVAVRLANDQGEPFISIGLNEWKDLQTIGQRIKSNTAVSQDDIDVLRLAASLSWEFSTLIGQGFTDGEHPVSAGPDRIKNLLNGPDGRHYCYYVSAEFEGDAGLSVVHSVPYFTQAILMNQLSKADAYSLKEPVIRGEWTNLLIPSTSKAIQSGAAIEQYYCHTEWELRSNLPDSELIISQPQAETSVITGGHFVDAGESYSGSGSNTIIFEGLSFKQDRKLSFEVPYFDSDIWLDLIAADSWDRRRSFSTQKIQPLIEYKGICLSISQGRWESGVDKFYLQLDQLLSWRADPLARNSKGKIQLLFKNPTKDPLSLNCQIGAAFPTEDGNWAGEVTGLVNQGEFGRLTDGTLVVNGFSARIIEMIPGRSGVVTCVFEAVVKCAGTEFYVTSGGLADAQLLENPNIGDFWLKVAEIDLMDGYPILYEAGIERSVIEEILGSKFDHSFTVNFSTRMWLDFEEQEYLGLVSIPLAMPYIHPIPKAPEICFELQQLACDYYGRTILRVEIDCCPHIDKHYQSKLKVAEGNLSEEDFSEQCEEGLFGPQLPMNDKLLWEVFDNISNFTEGAELTLGINYVRGSDSAESKSTLDQFEVRRSTE